MILGIDPKVDYAFKRVFGVERNKPILLSLVNAVLGRPPERQVVEVELLNPFNLADFEGDKYSVVDLKARDQSGQIFLIEMQMVVYPELVKRYLFYLASNYRSQLAEGEDYTQLRPVILIAFQFDPLFPQVSEYHLEFRLQDAAHGVVFTDDLEVHTIELSKLDADLAACRGSLERWGWLLMHAMDLDPEHLPSPLTADPRIVDAVRELEMIARNDKDREEYEARLDRQRTERALQRHFETVGEARGIAVGEARGRERGELIGRIEVLRRISGKAPLESGEIDRLTVEQLRQAADELERGFVPSQGAPDSAA